MYYNYGMLGIRIIFDIIFEDIPFATLLVLLSINVVFSYLSVTKSRVLIQHTAKMASNSRAAVAILSDFVLTVIILAVYLLTVFVVTEIFAYRSFESGAFGHVGGVTFGRNAYIKGIHDTAFYMTQIPFFTTISMTFILSVLYSCSLLLLVLLGYAGKVALDTSCTNPPGQISRYCRGSVGIFSFCSIPCCDRTRSCDLLRMTLGLRRGNTKCIIPENMSGKIASSGFGTKRRLGRSSTAHAGAGDISY